MAKASSVLKTTLAVADTLASVEPELAVLMKAVQYGIIGVKSVRMFFASEGHDVEKLDVIETEALRRAKRWQDTTF